MQIQTSLSGSQNPTVCMSPTPDTGKKVHVDNLSHSASSGLPKRQGHGQRRELEAVLSAGSQPGTGTWQSTATYGAWSPVPYPLTDVPQPNPELGSEATQFHVSILSAPPSEGSLPWIRPSGPPGWHASSGTPSPAAGWQEQQHCSQLLVLTPVRLLIWERRSLSRGMVASSFSFQDCLWVCLSAIVCKVCTQTAEATKVAKQLIIEPAFFGFTAGEVLL